VVATEASPTVRRWELAARLRELRIRAGLSLDEVATELLCSPSKISRLENAARAASARDVRDLARIYGVSDQVRDNLMDLVRESKQRAWWENYDEVASRSSTYIGLEEAASAIEWYETIRIPGLLQTPDYARAFLHGIIPSLDNDALDQYVASRGERQRRLAANPPLRLWAILDEAAVRKKVGGAKVMHDQIMHIIHVAKSLPNVTVQLVPDSRGSHAGMDGPFEILKFPQDTLSDIVYVEGRSGQLFLTRKQDLDLFNEMLDYLRASAASPDESTAMLEDIAQRTLANSY
jgi:transcriptional regulator with XRE-family HTH domain